MAHVQIKFGKSEVRVVVDGMDVTSHLLADGFIADVLDVDLPDALVVRADAEVVA